MFPLNDKLYFIKEDDVFVIDKPGNVKILLKDLSGKKEGGHNAVFGIWTDSAQNIYIANSDFKKVQQLNDKGHLIDFYKSENGWFPTGGLFDDGGNLWLLECSADNQVRVKKIIKEVAWKPQTHSLKKSSSEFIFNIAGSILITAILIFILKRKKKLNSTTK